MSETLIRDTQTKSRKGRRPIGGQAMTAAQRKQRQRDKAKADRDETPSWLQLRHDIWQLVQDRFMFANAAELANALHAIAAAINYSLFAVKIQDSDPSSYLAVAMGRREPDQWMTEGLDYIFPYKVDLALEQKYPGIQDPILYEVVRDVLNGSRIDDDEQQTADIEE